MNSLFDGELSDTPGMEDSRDVSTDTARSGLLLTPSPTTTSHLSADVGPVPSMTNPVTTGGETGEDRCDDDIPETPNSHRGLAIVTKVSIMLHYASSLS